MSEKLTWLEVQGGYCLSVRAALIQGHGSELPPLFAPVLSFFQPFHDLSTPAKEAPGQTVAVKGERCNRVEGSWLNAGLSKLLYSSQIWIFFFFLFFNFLQVNWWQLFNFAFLTVLHSFVETNQQKLADIVHVAQGGWQSARSGLGLADWLPILGWLAQLGQRAQIMGRVF